MRRHPRLQDQRKRTDAIHPKAGAEVGGATPPEEPPARPGRRQGGLPTAPPASLAALGRPAVYARPPARRRALDGAGPGFLAIDRIQPPDVETLAGELGEKSEQWPGQAFSDQVLTLLAGEKLAFARRNQLIACNHVSHSKPSSPQGKGNLSLVTRHLVGFVLGDSHAIE